MDPGTDDVEVIIPDIIPNGSEEQSNPPEHSANKRIEKKRIKPMYKLRKLLGLFWWIASIATLVVGSIGLINLILSLYLRGGPNWNYVLITTTPGRDVQMTVYGIGGHKGDHNIRMQSNITYEDSSPKKSYDMAARWNLLMTSSVCLVLYSLCITEQRSEDRGAMLQVGRQVYKYNDHTYTFHYQRSVTWKEARSICARESKGSYLAVIEDMEEAEFVAEAMAGRVYNFVSLKDVWIGGHYVTDRWIWNATGDVIPRMDGYPPWGLSAGIRGMDCLLLGRLLWNRPKFQELQCNRRRSFLCEVGCIRLSDTDRGHWEPAYCAEQAGEMGDKCKFVCNPEYQHRGSDVIECTGVGWNGTGGFGILPKCSTLKELVEDFVGKINDTLSNKKKAGLLIFKDGSQYDFLMDLTIYKALATCSPLSANRDAGIITFNYTGNMDIHHGANHKCKFLDKTDELYSTNILAGRDLAWRELSTYSGRKHVFVFLVTEELTGYYYSFTTLFAENLKSKGQIEFTIGKSNYQRDKMKHMATQDDEGPPNFFGVFIC